jgi:hypothetical protein
MSASTALKLTWLAIAVAAGAWLLWPAKPPSSAHTTYDLRDSIVGYSPDWAEPRDDCNTPDSKYQLQEEASLAILKAFADARASIQPYEALRFFSHRQLRNPVCPSPRLYAEVKQAAIRAHLFDPRRPLSEVQLAFVSKLVRELGIRDPFLMEAVARTAFHEILVPSDLFHSDLRPVARSILAEFGSDAEKWSAQAFSLMGAEDPLQTTAAQLAVASGHPQALARTRDLMASLLATLPATKPVPRRVRNRLYELAYAMSASTIDTAPYSGPVADLLGRKVESWAPPYGMIEMPPSLMCVVGEHLGGAAAEVARRQDFCLHKPSAHEQ